MCERKASTVDSAAASASGGARSYALKSSAWHIPMAAGRQVLPSRSGQVILIVGANALKSEESQLEDIPASSESEDVYGIPEKGGPKSTYIPTCLSQPRIILGAHYL